MKESTKKFIRQFFNAFELMWRMIMIITITYLFGAVFEAGMINTSIIFIIGFYTLIGWYINYDTAFKEKQ